MVRKIDKDGFKNLINDNNDEYNEFEDSSIKKDSFYVDTLSNQNFIPTNDFNHDTSEPLFISPSNSHDFDEDDFFSQNRDNISRNSFNSSNSSISHMNIGKKIYCSTRVHFELIQEKNDQILTVKFYLKNLDPEKKASGCIVEKKSLYIDYEDSFGVSCQLEVKNLYDAVTRIQYLEVFSFYIEVKLLKTVALEWPQLHGFNEPFNRYLIDKFDLYSSFSSEKLNSDKEESNEVFDETNLNVSKNYPSNEIYNFFLENKHKKEKEEFAKSKIDLLNNVDRDFISDSSPENNQALKRQKEEYKIHQRESLWNQSMHYPNTDLALINQEKSQIGYTGLDNLGNTCYMNSVLQCLCNTSGLREFFLTKNINLEINRENPFGSRGNVAIGFYNLVVQLWNGKHISYSPEKFKHFISSKMKQFSDFNQHDALEYMEHFLDLLHEDMNRVDRTKTIVDEPLDKDEDSYKDSELADIMWKRNLKRNNSIIVDLFYGQLKSHLSCSVCAKNSLTFDPFVFLPVPLPKPQITYVLYYFSLDYSKKPFKFFLTGGQDIKCINLLQSVSDRVKCEVKNLRLLISSPEKTEIIENDVQVSQYDPCLLSVFEVLDSNSCEEKVYNFIVRQCLITVSSSYRHFKVNNPKFWIYNDWNPNVSHNQSITPTVYKIGSPFMISIPESQLNYKNLSSVLKNRSRHSIDINIFELKFENDVKVSKSLVDSQISKLDLDSNNENDKNSSISNSDLDSSRQNLSFESSSSKQESLSNDTVKENIEIKVEPFYIDNKKVRCVRKVETMNEFNENNFNIYHTKLTNKFHELKRIDDKDDKNNQSFIESLKDSNCLVMQWRDDPSSDYRTRIFCKDLDCSTNFYEYLNQFQEKTTTTLEDCLKIFTDKEILSLEDSWYCPKCKKPQKACKQLTIWRLPEVLIIHLKRFSYKHCTRDKIDNFIEFPLYGLDLKNFCSSNQSNMENKTIYDLFAVINHFGGIYGGHYTAAAKTVFQNKEYGWRMFDDNNVQDVDESSIVTNNAYILFYKLRNESKMEVN